MKLPGDKLVTLCEQARVEIVLVAPFIKATVMERVLDSIPSQVNSIRCVTRWRPEEIAAGVSDVEVVDIIKTRQNARLFIHPLLHAKYFRSDRKCIIGSCNLTQRALGWAMPANLELMFEASVDDQVLSDFERIVFANSFEASEKLKNEVTAAADLIRDSGKQPALLSEEGLGDDDPETFAADVWLPLCTRPERLFQIYAGEDPDRIIGWTLEAGQRDIRSLRIPLGLGAGTFQQFVAASIQQTPLAQRIHAMAVNPITSEEGANLITSSIDEQYLVYSPEEHWNTIRAWLLHFLPRVYRQPSGSNNLQRGTEIGTLRR